MKNSSSKDTAASPLSKGSHKGARDAPRVGEMRLIWKTVFFLTRCTTEQTCGVSSRTHEQTHRSSLVGEKPVQKSGLMNKHIVKHIVKLSGHGWRVGWFWFGLFG